MPTIDLYASDDVGTIDDGQFDVVTTDYAEVLVQLLPEGFAWNWKPNGFFDRMRYALAREFSRAERRARELLAEMNPRTADEMIGDWEAMLNITHSSTNLEARRVAVQAKFTARVGATGQAFILNLAGNLGYPNAEIRRYNDPFLCISECTHSLYGSEGGWIFAWTLIANDSTDNDVLLEELIAEYARRHEIANVEFPE